jgi:hypothetical protein
MQIAAEATKVSKTDTAGKGDVIAGYALTEGFIIGSLSFLGTFRTCLTYNSYGRVLKELLFSKVQKFRVGNIGL